MTGEDETESVAEEAMPFLKNYVCGLKFRFQLLYILGGCHKGSTVNLAL